MAKKPTVTTLASGFNSTETLNANFEALRDGFDNTLSLDGSTPNAMEADLDLNGNNLIGAAGLLVNGTDYLAAVEAAKAAALVAQAAAETAETNAETAETNAESSETAAASSASAASSSATASAASAVDSTNNGAAQVALAAAQVVLANTARTGAETAETNAETAAALSTTNGAAQVVLATAQVALASTEATNAATSATTATTQASTATTQAGIATTKASEASASASAAAASAASITDEEANAAASAAASAGSATASANSAAASAAALDNFDDRYLGPKSTEPTLDNDGDALVSGALYFATTSNAMQVYDGANWIAASAAGVASLNLYEYTTTAGQTTFTGSDDNGNSISFIQGNEIVVLNGIILDPSDYNSTSGTSIVLNVAATAGDLLNVYAFKSFTVADTVPASTGGTFGGNVTVTGTLAAATLTGDGSQLTGLPAGYTDTDVATYLAGTSPTVGGLTTTADVSFGDNDKAIFGAGSDLQIYHDGSHSIINDVGTGHLKLQGTDVRIQSSNGAENFLVADEDGAVRLYNDNSQKFQTTSTGIDVTGTVTADGLTVDGTATIAGGDSEYLKISHNTRGGDYRLQTSGVTAGNLRLSSAGKTLTLFGDNGDISFYEDTGTTPKFFWDASAESLGIGTSSPSEELEIASSSPTIRLTDTNDSTYGAVSYNVGALFLTGDQTIRFNTDDTEAMRIDSSGNVGIGTSSPSTTLQVEHDSGGSNSWTNAGSTAMLTETNAANPASIKFNPATAANGAQIVWGGAAGDGPFVFRNYNTERMRIDSSGNVGIGTTSPTTELDVDGTITATSFSGDGSALTGVGGSTTAGAVGTYAWLARNGNTAGIVAGTTLAGSSLVFASVDSISSYSYNTVLSAAQGASPSGTWRIMGTTHNINQPTKGCLFVRIS